MNINSFSFTLNTKTLSHITNTACHITNTACHSLIGHDPSWMREQKQMNLNKYVFKIRMNSEGLQYSE